MSTQLISLKSRGIISLQGEDARPMLQGLVTQDMTLLSPKRALYTALLSPKGRYLYDFFIIEREGILYLDIERAQVIPLLNYLNTYTLRKKILIQDESKSWTVYSVLGEGQERHYFDLPTAKGSCDLINKVTAYIDPRLQNLGVRLLAPNHLHVDLKNATPGEEGDYHAHRTRLCVPEGDFEQNQSIILEYGLEYLNAISFTKGCYLGQELMARTKHRGALNKIIMGIDVHGPFPPPGTQILQGDKEAGRILKSRAGSRGLALIRFEAYARAEKEGDSFHTGEAVIVPKLPPWIPLKV